MNTLLMCITKFRYRYTEHICWMAVGIQYSPFSARNSVQKISILFILLYSILCNTVLQFCRISIMESKYLMASIQVSKSNLAKAIMRGEKRPN